MLKQPGALKQLNEPFLVQIEKRISTGTERTTPSLCQRKRGKADTVRIGDIVIFHDNEQPRGLSSLDRIETF